MPYRVKALFAAAIFLGLGALLFVPLPKSLSVSASAPSGEASLDALHFPFFAVLTVCLFILLEWPARRFKLGILGQLGSTAIISVIAAIVSEIVQGLAGRSASLLDFRNDLLGIVTAITILFLVRHPSSIGRTKLWIIGLCSITLSTVIAVISVLTN